MPTTLCLSGNAQQPCGDKTLLSLEEAIRQCSWSALAGELVEIILPDQGDVSVLYNAVCTKSTIADVLTFSVTLLGCLRRLSLLQISRKPLAIQAGSLLKPGIYSSRRALGVQSRSTWPDSVSASASSPGGEGELALCLHPHGV